MDARVRPGFLPAGSTSWFGSILAPHARLFLVTLSFALAACDRPQDVASARTGSVPTTLPPSFVSLVAPPHQRTIRFRITAPRRRALYLEHCNGAVSWGLEHQSSGDWVPAWGAEINGCHSVPIEIAAGTAREFDEVLALRPGETLPPGPYRIAVYGLYFTHDSPDHSASLEVPHALRMSQPFTPALSTPP